MVNTFKPGDKVRCIDADYDLVEGEVCEVESSRLDTAGHEFVNIVDPLRPGGMDGPFFAGRFEPVAEEPVKMFGTLAPEDVSVGKEYWLDPIAARDRSGGGCHFGPHLGLSRVRVLGKDGPLESTWDGAQETHIQVARPGSSRYLGYVLPQHLAPIIDGQKESDDVTTEITGLHRKDIQLIADELQRAAEDRGWRSEYGEFLERINKRLSVKLEPSPSPEKKFWTEFSFRCGDVLVSLTGYTHLRVAGGSAWRDDTDRLANDFDSEARCRLVRGTSKLYRYGIQVTPPES